jgi:hypothetical protein
MAYLNRTITLRFNGESTLDSVFSDPATGKPMVLANLGDDVWVVVRNPLLMPQSMLLPKREVATNPDGSAVNRQEAIAAGAEVIADLIAEWNLTDVMDLADEPAVLPLPATVDMILGQVPAAIGETIGTMLARARNPR